jgi:hypothetical protein
MLEEALTAEEIFVTLGDKVCGIGNLNDTVIGDGSVGPLTTRIQTDYYNEMLSPEYTVEIPYSSYAN